MATSRISMPESMAVGFPSTPGPVPCARWAHAAAAVGNKLYVYGGMGVALLDDLHVLDGETMTWKELNVVASRSQGKPEKLMGHAAVAVGPTIWVFGGQQGRQYKRATYSLDTRNHVWEQHDVSVSPPARAGHAMTCAQGHIYMYGGQGKKVFQDLCRFDPSTKTWVTVTTPTSGPGPRRGHTLVWDGNDNLILYGGRTGSSGVDLFVYTISRNQWWPPTVQGANPGPRRSHTAVITAPGVMLMFGGCNDQGAFFNTFHLLNLNTFTWTSPNILTATPPLRAGHVCCLLKNKVVMHGGINLNQVYDALVVVDVSFQTELAEVAGELCNMVDSSGQASPSVQLMQMQLQELLVKRNMQELHKTTHDKVVHAEDLLVKEKEITSALRKEVLELKLALEETSNEKSRFQNKCRELIMQKAKESQQSQELLATLNELRRKLSEQEAAVVSAQSDKAAMAKELGILASRFARLKSEQGNMDRARDHTTIISRSNQNAMISTTDIEGSLSSFTSQVSRSRDWNLDDSVADAYTQEISRLQLQLSEARNGLQDCQVELGKLRGDTEALQDCSAGELQQLHDELQRACKVVWEVRLQRASEAAQKTAPADSSCSLCMERPKGMVFNCGHQCCAQCAIKVDTCPFCRTKVSAKIRLFDA